MSTYFVQGSTMDAIADAINAKTGGSSAMTPAQMVTAIGTISGGGSSGYAKKSGSFVPAEDYTYTGLANQTYSGGILIATELSRIDAIIIWSEEWAAETETSNCFGLSMAFPANPPTDANAANPCHYYSGNSWMRNGTNNLAVSPAQGFFFHSMSNNIPEGAFGLRCHSATFPIRAGHTIRWEAWGAE